VYAAVLVHDLIDARMLTRAIEDPDAVSQNRLELSDRLTATGGILQFALLVVTAVVFLLWFHRAARNLPALGVLEERTPAWSVGSWFVPFVNFVVPKWVSNDLWRAGDRSAQYPLVLDVWWAFWLISSILGNIAGRAFAGADELREFRSADYADAAASGIGIVAAILCIRVVKSITRRHDERRAQRDAEIEAGTWSTGPSGFELGPDRPFSKTPAWTPSDELG
jgi:hypothetical protein